MLFYSWGGVQEAEKCVWLSVAIPSDSLQRRIWVRYVGMTYQIDPLKVPVDSDDTLRRIVAFRPSYIHGFSTYIGTLAEAVARQGCPPGLGQIRMVVATAENLLPGARARIEQAFSCPVFNRYGAREIGGACAQNCPEFQALHVNTEAVFFEVVDEGGEWVRPGQVGRLVATDLTNYAAPLIRYYTGDLAVLGSGGCDCGRGFPLIERIDGRQSEVVVLPDGSLLSATALSYYLFVPHDDASIDYTSFFSTFQLAKRPQGELLLRVVPADGVSLSVMNEALKGLSNLAAGLFRGTRVTVVAVDSIPCESSGKRLIIRDESRATQEDVGAG